MSDGFFNRSIFHPDSSLVYSIKCSASIFAAIVGFVIIGYCLCKKKVISVEYSKNDGTSYVHSETIVRHFVRKAKHQDNLSPEQLQSQQPQQQQQRNKRRSKKSKNDGRINKIIQEQQEQQEQHQQQPKQKVIIQQRIPKKEVFNQKKVKKKQLSKMTDPENGQQQQQQQYESRPTVITRNIGNDNIYSPLNESSSFNPNTHAHSSNVNNPQTNNNICISPSAPPEPDDPPPYHVLFDAKTIRQ
ncbi:hypothetical protein SNEBB_008040 [Seison nebaliae]|nr:hypothetical protein SNEBB_008040 [Seison nebaliae]